MQAESSAPPTDVWFDRATALIERAGEELAGDANDEVISTVSLALECLKAAWGDAPEEGLEDHFRNDVPDCTCPSDLIERGGWASTCPRHGVGR